jgi:hypothetical protein
MSLPGTRRVAGWLFWIVFPAISIAAIALAVIGLSDHLGQHYAAVPGKFTVTTRGCHEHVCSVTGTFVGNDGVLVAADVPGDPRWNSGESHQAFYDIGSGEVRAKVERWDPSTSVLSIAGGTTYLAVVGWLAVAGWRTKTEVTTAPNRVISPG